MKFVNNYYNKPPIADNAVHWRREESKDEPDEIKKNMNGQINGKDLQEVVDSWFEFVLISYINYIYDAHHPQKSEENVQDGHGAWKRTPEWE